MLRALLRRAASPALLAGAAVVGGGVVAVCSAEQADMRKMKSLAVAQYASNFPIEDRYACYEDAKRSTRVCAVFDGHGGWQCSEFVQKYLVPKVIEYLANADEKNNTVEHQIEKAFNEVEKSFTDVIRSAFQHGFGLVSRVGACALVCVQRQGRLYVANSGDCRAVLGTRAVDADGVALGEYIAVAMSRDHNARIPADQALLRQMHPGESDIIMCKRPSVCYVKGRLQPTRSFGDAYLKYKEFNGPPYVDGDRSRGRHVPEPYTPPYITHVPEIISRPVSEHDEFIIAATDGLWDFLENKEAVEVVARCVREGKPQQASQRLVEAALTKAAAESHMTVQELLALPVGRARRVVHDDTTVVVMYL